MDQVRQKHLHGSRHFRTSSSWSRPNRLEWYSSLHQKTHRRRGQTITRVPNRNCPWQEFRSRLDTCWQDYSLGVLSGLHPFGVHSNSIFGQLQRIRLHLPRFSIRQVRESATRSSSSELALHQQLNLWEWNIGLHWSTEIPKGTFSKILGMI